MCIAERLALACACRLVHVRSRAAGAERLLHIGGAGVAMSMLTIFIISYISVILGGLGGGGDQFATNLGSRTRDLVPRTWDLHPTGSLITQGAHAQ